VPASCRRRSFPIPFEREKDPPQVALVVNLLGAILNDFCSREKLAVSLTATVSDLRELVRAKMQKEAVPATNQLMTGWRKDFVLPVLLEFSTANVACASRICRRSRRSRWSSRRKREYSYNWPSEVTRASPGNH
jgi:hypothetical protein